MAKRKPSGFYATCQCGHTIGALDAIRTDNKDMGKIMGKWLADGCTVRPIFDSTFSIRVHPCECDGSTNHD
jgi:hypothetical protein